MPISTDIAEPVVETEQEIETQEPGRYKCIIHNDDRTTMDFVIMLLRNIFHKTLPEAFELMLAVHENGQGVAGIYTKEVADEKAEEANRLADAHGFPLKTTSEEE